MGEKLVRDKIPAIAARNEEVINVRLAKPDEYEDLLRRKLDEEIAEFYANPSAEEMADILEVLSAIGDRKRVNRDEVTRVRRRKAVTNGVFREMVVLITKD